jgi:hypothetical protein
VTGLRRSLLLVAIALTTLLGLSVTPAQAAFTARAALPVTATALTVAPPTELSTAGTRCVTYGGQYNGNWNSSRTLQVRISWKASATTRGVIGYQLTALFKDGSTHPVATVDAHTTQLAQDVDASYAAQDARVRITTLTSYGWTSTPAQTGPLTC